MDCIKCLARCSSTIVVLVMMSLSPSSAQAASAFALGCGGPLFINCEFDSTNNSSALAQIDHFGAGPESRSFRVVASAAPGEAHVYATASAQDQGGQIATGQAGFSDIAYPVVPVGVPSFNVTVTLLLEGVCSGTPGATAGYGNASCGVGISATAGRGTNVVLPGLDAPGEIVQTLLLRPGDDLPLEVLLQVWGTAHFGTFVGDFGNTGRLFLSSSTPGVSFLSESGHDYSLSAVPEPSASWLMIAGLGMAGLMRWRRARSLSRT